MYVQYQKPVNGGQHVPVVMVHGCCLSSKTWETTPDGRMGWNEYFVRKNRSVYMADQVSRARSGFDATIINSVKSGAVPPAQLPNVLFCQPPGRLGGVPLRADFRHRVSGRAVSRAGRRRTLQADDSGSSTHCSRRQIPHGKIWRRSPFKLKGAVLMGHSESGFFPGRGRADRSHRSPRHRLDRDGVHHQMTPQQLATMAKIPILVMFGDHLGDVKGPFGRYGRRISIPVISLWIR